MSDFSKSMENAYRRVIRQAIKHSPLTRTEKEVTTVIVNLWLVHRNGLGFIHPSKRLIAKRAKCTERTVQRCLQMLKASGTLIVLRNEKGGKRLAPHYRLSIPALLALCDADIPIEQDGYLKMMGSTYPNGAKEASAKQHPVTQNVGYVDASKGDICTPKCLPLRESECLPVYSTYTGCAGSKQTENTKPAKIRSIDPIFWMNGEVQGNA